MTRPLVGLLSVILLAACDNAATGPAVGADAPPISIKAGGQGTCALMKTGRLVCWGRTGLGSEGSKTPKELPGDIEVVDFTRSIGPGWGDVCAAAKPSGVYCWGVYSTNWDGYNGYGPDPAYPTLLQDTLALAHLAAGQGHTCGIALDGSANCWGSSLAGKRGEGEPSLRAENLIVNRVAGELAFTALGADETHTCGLTTSGDVYCWGWSAQLGDSLGSVSTDDCFFYPSCAWAPLPVRGVRGVIALAVGGLETCALTQNAAIWCWSPAGTVWPYTLGWPKLRELPEPAAAVTVGGWFACALGGSGKVYCWGEPGPWRGTDDIRDLVEVNTSIRFVSITAGFRHICGVDHEGVAYCWGQNYYGELGDGTLEPSSHPVRVQFPGQSSTHDRISR